MTRRIVLMLDGANLHHTVRNLGFEVDFKRILEEFDKFGTIVRAYFYTATKEDDHAQPLLDWLDYNGFTVRTKLARERDDGDGRRRIRRSIGVDLAVDALEITRHVDRMFLFSGDGDFRRIVEGVQRLGITVTVVSSIRTTPPMAANELRRQADHFIEIDTIRRSIERLPRSAGC